MGTKHPMSPSSSCPIKPYHSHCPFDLSYATINLISTPSPMQTTHIPLVPPPILTNHTPPISFPSQFPTFHVNMGPQPYTFPIPFDHAHVGPFHPFTLLAPLVAHDQTPQATLIFSKHLQRPPKVSCPTYWCQFSNWSLICNQHFYQSPNSSNLNPHDHPDWISSFVPTLFTLTHTWVLFLDVLRSFHSSFHCLRLYNHILPLYDVTYTWLFIFHWIS
jgi:hypothetical protein